jgi:hypothetical protein
MVLAEGIKHFRKTMSSDEPPNSTVDLRQPKSYPGVD